MSPDDLLSSLDLSAKLAEQAAEDTTAQWKKAFVDCHTFGQVKEAVFSEAALKGLGMGAGASVPALLAAWMATNHAKSQAQDLVRDARNQALLVGGLAGAGQGIKHLLAPNKWETTEQESYPGGMGDAFRRKITKVSSDKAESFVKLSAVLQLDTFLTSQLAKVAGEDKIATEECFLMNREHGVELLREILDV